MKINIMRNVEKMTNMTNDTQSVLSIKARTCVTPVICHFKLQHCLISNTDVSQQHILISEKCGVLLYSAHLTQYFAESHFTVITAFRVRLIDLHIWWKYVSPFFAEISGSDRLNGQQSCCRLGPSLLHHSRHGNPGCFSE